MGSAAAQLPLAEEAVAVQELAGLWIRHDHVATAIPQPTLVEAGVNYRAPKDAPGELHGAMVDSGQPRTIVGVFRRCWVFRWWGVWEEGWNTWALLEGEVQKKAKTLATGRDLGLLDLKIRFRIGLPWWWLLLLLGENRLLLMLLRWLSFR